MAIKPYNYSNPSSSQTVDKSSSGIQPFNYSTTVKQNKLSNKLRDFALEDEARVTQESKFNFKRDIGGVVKALPGAIKQVAIAPFKYPIDTARAVVTGAADVGPAIVNLGAKIVGAKGRLPYLSQAFNETLEGDKKDVLGAISEGTKTAAGFALGQKTVGALGVKNPIARNVLGDIVGGQVITDSEATLKERGVQALFDSAFGLVIGGTGPLAKKVFGKKVVPPPEPKPKLTAAEYSISQGYEPIVPTDKLPVIKAGRKPKGEPTVKLGSQPKVFSPDGTPVVSKTGIPKQFNPQKATPEFKARVVESAKILDDTPDFTPSTHIKEAAQFQHYIDNGQEAHVLARAKNLIDDPNLNQSSAFKLLEEKYLNDFNAGDKSAAAKLDDLSKSNVGSQAGKDLSFQNMGVGADGPASLMSKARNIKKSALLKQGIDIDAEIGKEFNKTMAKIKGGMSVNEAITKFIDDITC